MGLLVEGVWHDQWYDTQKSQGTFVRADSQFRSWVTADGTKKPRPSSIMSHQKSFACSIEHNF